MAEPSSFYGQPAQIARLPMPGNPAAELAPGLNAVARAVTGAAENNQQTKFQVASINRQRQLQVQTGDVATRLADAQGQLNVDLLNLRQQSHPGAAGHDEAVAERIQRFRDDAHDMLGNDPEVQSRFVDNIASIAATARTGEVKWSIEQGALKSVTDSSGLQNALQSNIRTAIANGTFDPKMLENGDKLDETAVRALPIGGTEQEKMIKDRRDARIVTVIDARTDIDPHGVLADIDAGKYGEIDDKTLGVLRNQADVAARRLDNEAKQASGAQAGADRAHASNAVEDVNSGMLVDVKQLATWRAQFAPSDKPEDIRLVHDLDTAIAKNVTTAKFDASTNPERRAALAEVETHKDWQKDQTLVAAHTQLQALINRDDQASDKDPLTLYQRQTGQPIGDLKLGDPAAMQGRFVAADKAAERFEKPVPVIFTAAEADQLRGQYNQADVNGKAEFMQVLGAYGSQRARQMMHQIAPGKPELVRLAELSASHDPAVQGIVREASDGSAVPMKEGVAAAVRSQAQREFGSAFSRLPGDRQAAILQVATWVYAHRAAAAGKAQVLDHDIARQAIDAALGGTGGKGGLGRRNGNDVVLPMGSTQDDFDRVLAMGAAHPDTVRSAANGVPQWGGRDMHSREWLNLVPVLISDTGSQALYAFRSPGGSGYVKTNNGRDDYVVDMRKLAGGLQGSAGFNAQPAAHGYVRK